MQASGLRLIQRLPIAFYRDGEHYEVEFAEPFPCTVTLRRDDIHPG